MQLDILEIRSSSATPLSVFAGGPRVGNGAIEADRGDQERFDQRSIFSGTFPGQPVMPGVLILESMAQAGELLLLQEVKDRNNKLLYLASMNNVKFRRPIVPGDQMRVEVNILAWKGESLQDRSNCSRRR